jgi:hypothetical protein
VSGVEHGELLVRFVDAVHAIDGSRIEAVRADVVDALGQEALVDAAGVIGNFCTAVRIADGCGIPLDLPLDLLSLELREQIGATAFGSAQNTPAQGAVKRAVGRMAAKLLAVAEPQVWRLVARVRTGIGR